jgi:hypothetical protein
MKTKRVHVSGYTVSPHTRKVKVKHRTRRHGGGGANLNPSMSGGGGGSAKRSKLAGLPTIREVLGDLVAVRDEIRGYGDVDETDVRLQVHGGSWSLHSGDAQYDTDHRGYWGAGSVSKDDSQASLRTTAKELIAEVEEDYAMKGPDEDEDYW